MKLMTFCDLATKNKKRERCSLGMSFHILNPVCFRPKEYYMQLYTYDLRRLAMTLCQNSDFTTALSHSIPVSSVIVSRDSREIVGTSRPLQST